jgi:cytochrome b
MTSFRLLHILFAASVIVAYLTAEELGLVHAWIGYAVGAIVLVRLALALVGKSGFSFHRLRPRLSAAPLGMTALRHPVIAQTLTLALALDVTGLAATGVAMDRGGTLVGQSIRADDDENEAEGRAEHEDASRAIVDLPGAFIPVAYANDGGAGESEEEEGPLAELHEALGSLLLPLVLLHVAYLLLFRFDLARFMLFIPKPKR